MRYNVLMSIEPNIEHLRTGKSPQSKVSLEQIMSAFNVYLRRQQKSHGGLARNDPELRLALQATREEQQKSLGRMKDIATRLCAANDGWTDVKKLEEAWKREMEGANVQSAMFAIIEEIKQPKNPIDHIRGNAIVEMRDVTSFNSDNIPTEWRGKKKT